ncbi:hypothetical protein CPB86DRAFT_299093 [Serendipita vermifera]|nr:hypothetical protein CPB86DRAFT_299093 [Serendipita vermifera]
MSHDLNRLEKIISNTFSGKRVLEDGWTTMWCNTNWSDLVQAVPLLTALQGSMLVLASTLNDFSLTTQKDGAPPVAWEYASDPSSFKICLQQLALGGDRSFEEAHANMDRLSLLAKQLPQSIATVIQLLLQGSPEEITLLFPSQLDGVTCLALNCQNAASQCEANFKNAAGLAQELIVACTRELGNALEATNAHSAIVAKQKEIEQQLVNEANEANNLMKKSFTDAEKDFGSFLKELPPSMQLLGRSALESLLIFVSSSANLGVSVCTTRPKMSTFNNSDQGSRGVSNSQAPSGVSSVNNVQTVLDPDVLQAQRALNAIYTIQMLLSGGEGGKPDWENIKSGASGNPSGGNFARYQLQNILDNLQPNKDKAE